MRGHRIGPALVVVVDHCRRDVLAQGGPPAQHQPRTGLVERRGEVPHPLAVLLPVPRPADDDDGLGVLLAHQLNHCQLPLGVAVRRAQQAQPPLRGRLLLHPARDEGVERPGHVVDDERHGLRRRPCQRPGVRVHHVVELAHRPQHLGTRRGRHRVVPGQHARHRRHGHPRQRRHIPDRGALLAVGLRLLRHGTPFLQGCCPSQPKLRAAASPSSE